MARRGEVRGDVPVEEFRDMMSNNPAFKTLPLRRTFYNDICLNHEEPLQ